MYSFATTVSHLFMDRRQHLQEENASEVEPVEGH
jgi:hypothetical protein